MRIRKIVVIDLFGIFRHEIPLNMNDHITIIHGPNGFGKTVLLKMIDAVFKLNYSALKNTPFSELAIEFDDDTILSINKKLIQEDQLKLIDTPEDQQKLIDIPEGQDNIFQTKSVYDGKLVIEHKKNGELLNNPHVIEDIKYSMELIKDISQYIPAANLPLKRAAFDEWLYLPTGELFSVSDVINRFEIPVDVDKESLNKVPPKWLKQIENSINIKFIGTHRLFSGHYSFNDYYQNRRQKYEGRLHRYEDAMVPSVISYSRELAEAIQRNLTEYAVLSQSLDRTFPKRLVDKKNSATIEDEDLRNNLLELEEKRKKLISSGLLDSEVEMIDFTELGEKIDDSNKNVLSVYVEDVKTKLAVFDELNDKIDLLVKMINSRFLHKRMLINKRNGFVFKTADGKTLSSSDLSSGEQHEVVMLYELLFKVKSNSLILIDEPELSLHILWQQQFLKDLQEITNLVDFDVLIATHSPQIIHDRWDLTVELKEPDNVSRSDC